MGLEVGAAAILSLLIAGAGFAKLWRPVAFEQGVARAFQIGTGEARSAATSVAAAELAIAALIALPMTRPFGIAASFGWLMIALAYQTQVWRSSGSCGCLGDFDPLRRLGPLRGFVYLAPYALLIVGLLALQLSNVALTPIVAFSVPLAFILLVALYRQSSGEVAPSPIEGGVTNALSRRSFLRRAAAVVAAIALLPVLGRLRALADTCGPWSCVRYEVVCICCGCSNGQSCDACYQRRRRTCQGSYGTYVQEQLVTGVCYANICSPCWRSYVSSCGRCCPCPA